MLVLLTIQQNYKTERAKELGRKQEKRDRRIKWQSWDSRQKGDIRHLKPLSWRGRGMLNIHKKYQSLHTHTHTHMCTHTKHESYNAKWRAVKPHAQSCRLVVSGRNIERGKKKLTFFFCNHCSGKNQNWKPKQKTPKQPKKQQQKQNKKYLNLKTKTITNKNIRRANSQTFNFWKWKIWTYSPLKNLNVKTIIIKIKNIFFFFFFFKDTKTAQHFAK